MGEFWYGYTTDEHGDGDARVVFDTFDTFDIFFGYCWMLFALSRDGSVRWFDYDLQS